MIIKAAKAITPCRAQLETMSPKEAVNLWKNQSRVMPMTTLRTLVPRKRAYSLKRM
jgi:hypothetical protein